MQVKVIDTGATIKKLPASYFLVPPVEGFEYFPTLPAWSFLIESSSGQRALFDLGVPTDWQEMAPAVSDRLKSSGWVIDAPNNVRDILEKHSAGCEVNSIIWRWENSQTVLHVDAPDSMHLANGIFL